MIRKSIIALAVLASFTGAQALEVQAADLPVKVAPKAQPLSFFNGYTGSGLYFGMYTQGGGGAVNGSVAGVGSASLTSTSASAGALAGYAWAGGNGNYFVAVEGMFGWQNFNGNTAGFSLSGPASFEQRLKVGAPLSTIMAVLPTFNIGTVAPLPPLPAGVVATNIHPYIMAGIHEDDISTNFGLANNKAWRVAPAIGIGTVTQLSNATAVDVWVETIFPEKGTCVGIGNAVGCGNVGQQVKGGLSVLW